LQDKESQLKELRMLVARNDPLMQSSIKNMSELHSKVTDRRGNLARLRTASAAARRPVEPWFLTEGVQSTVYGGGFVMPGIEPEEPIDLSNSGMAVRQRAKTSMAGPGAKRMKPDTAVARVRSPKLPRLPALA
jgi:hypothetical protein